MALDDTTLIIPGTRFIFTAPTSTAKPTSLTAPGTPWVDNGHTSDDGLTISFELTRPSAPPGAPVPVSGCRSMRSHSS